MLLLPLVENSFKYGFSETATSNQIDIDVIQSASNFEFRITNAITNSTDTSDNNHSGIGLKNLKNNLNLVYPNTHTFNVEETSETFTVTITLQDAQY